MIPKILLIIFMVFIAGCTTMAPKYERPLSPVPPELPKGQAYKDADDSARGRPAKEVRWRDFYRDEKLQKVLELALKNNRDLRVATLNIDKARAVYRIQRAELFPSINALGNYYEQRVPADISRELGEAMNVKQYTVNLGVSAWEIDFFGRIRSLKDRALEQYLATEHAFISVQVSLLAEVANAYLTLAADRENLKLAQSTLNTQEEIYRIIKRRYETGAASELELRQAQSRLETVRLDIPRYVRQVALDENALNLLVGMTVPSELLPKEFNEIMPPKDISTGLLSETLLSRPDILRAENQLKAANANIGAARAAFFPMITLTTSYGTTSEQLSGLFKAGSRTWTFSPQIVLPIFDAGSRWANLGAAKADRDIYLAQYEKAIQIAFREVADALAYRGTIEEQLKAQESLVDATGNTHRLARTRYLKGVDGYLSVLDAQRSLYTAQQGLIAVRLSRLNNLVTLYKVLGGGWMAEKNERNQRVSSQ